MHGREFAKNIPLADPDGRIVAGPFFVLSSASNKGVREDFVSCSQPRIAFDRRVMVHPTAVTEAHLRAYIGKCADGDACADLGTGFYNGGRMNLRGVVGHFKTLLLTSPLPARPKL